MKRLALTKDGQMTYCSSADENVGKGRCNHVDHQHADESPVEFTLRMQSEMEAKQKYPLKFNGLKESQSYDESEEYDSALGLNNSINEKTFDSYLEASKWLKSELNEHDNSNGYGIGKDSKGKVVAFYGYGE